MCVFHWPHRGTGILTGPHWDCNGFWKFRETAFWPYSGFPSPYIYIHNVQTITNKRGRETRFIRCVQVDNPVYISAQGLAEAEEAFMFGHGSLPLVAADALEVFDVCGEDRRTPELQA